MVGVTGHRHCESRVLSPRQRRGLTKHSLFGLVHVFVRSSWRDQQRRDVPHPRERAPGLERGTGNRWNNGLGSRGPLRLRGQPGPGGHLACPLPLEPRRSRWTEQFQEDPTDPRWQQHPPPGLPSSSQGRERPPTNSLAAPELRARPPTHPPGPNRFGLAGRQRKGCGPGPPSRGEEARTTAPRPSRSAKGSGRVAYCPRTCLAGPFPAVAA